MNKSKKIARFVKLKERIRDQKKRERLKVLNEIEFQRKKENEIASTQSQLTAFFAKNKFNQKTSMNETITLLDISTQAKKYTKHEIDALSVEDDAAMEKLVIAQTEVKQMDVIYEQMQKKEKAQRNARMRKMEDEAAMIQRSRHENRK